MEFSSHKLKKLILYLKTIFLIFRKRTCKAWKTKNFLYFSKKNLFPHFRMADGQATK